MVSLSMRRRSAASRDMEDYTTMKVDAKTVIAYLKTLDPEHRKVMSALRKLVPETVPKATETSSDGVFAYQVGEFVCAIASR